MARYEATRARRDTRGVAVVLGIMVVFAFTMILVASAPGKEILIASGANDANPMTDITSVYNRTTIQCAFTAMSCNLSP